MSQPDEILDPAPNGARREPETEPKQRHPVLHWPALRNRPPDLRLQVAHGVYGKVPGDAEFRWIGRSPDFGADLEVEGELNLGTEDKPTTAFLWRVGAGRCWAAKVYSSRAQDKFGRQGFLEKQVLEWIPDSGDSLVAAALCLLDQVSSFGDQVWWDQYEHCPWDDPKFAIKLPPPESISCTLQDLDRITQQGIRDLKSQGVGESQLTELYRQLLEGAPAPTWLNRLTTPLSSSALAVLLLPLEPELAGRLSLAGWLPSTSYDSKELGKRWDVIGQPRSYPLRSGNANIEARAGLMARCLLENNPEHLGPPAPSEPPPESEKSTVPSRTRLEVVFYRPDDKRLQLTPPADSTSELIKWLYEFACRVEKRRLFHNNLSEFDERFSTYPYLDTKEESNARLLWSWANELEDSRPDGVAFEQWQDKIDDLLTSALFLAPHIDIRCRDLPRSTDIPPLLLPVWCLNNRKDGIEKADRFAEKLHRETLLGAALLSLDCRRPKLHRLVVNQFRLWQQESELESVREILAEVLASPKAKSLPKAS